MGPLSALEAFLWPETVWPEPHNALWDSLSIDYESVAIGGAAASHTAAIPRRRWRPRLDDLQSFVDDYQAERPVGDELRRASLAYAVYRLAYTARCEHAIAVSRVRLPVTDVRSVLPRFAAELLA